MSRRGTRFISVQAASLLLFLLCGCNHEGADGSGVVAIFGGIGMGRGEFSYPRGLTLSPVDGCVFIVDKAARIQRFSPRGNYETEWRMPEFEQGKPTGLCVDRHNRVWVADTHYSRVMLFDRDGNELKRFGRTGRGPGEFIWPTNIAIDESDGSVLVGEYGGNDRISRFSADLAYRGSFASGDLEQGGTSRPQSIAIDASGVVWVADSAHHRICRYSRDGAFLGAVGRLGEGPDEFNYPYSLAIAPDRAVYVSDYGNNRVVRLGPDGRFLGSWGRMGREPGELRHAWSLALAGNGILYILDSWNSRVQLIRW